LLPVSERWHLAFAMTESVPVQGGRSAAEPVGQSSFQHAEPVPSRLSHVLSEVHARILRSLPKPETLTGPLATSCRCSAAGKRDQLLVIGTPRKWPATVSTIWPADPDSTQEQHATSASEDHSGVNSMPVDPAWPHSGLGLGTGSIPNRAVRSIPSTPFPANRCPAPWSRPGHKYQPVSCRSPFPPSRPLPLLPFLRFCPSHFRRIPCDLLPFFLGQLLQSGFDRLAA